MGLKLFLDMDGTVTESRQKMSQEMSDALSLFSDVIIISGAHHSQMVEQVGESFTLMSQNGNSNPIWERKLSEEEKEKVLSHIKRFATIEEDMLEDRGCQISYSFIGHHAQRERKVAFDPGGEKRSKLLEIFPPPEGIECKVGGTTCLDYFPKSCTKGNNIRRYIKESGWEPGECLYVGDALFKNGNDESVIGVIMALSVRNPQDTIAFLRHLRP